MPFDPRVSEVVNAQRRTFEEIGCITEDADPDFSGADEAFKTLRALSFYQQYNALLGQPIKRTVVDEIEHGARLTGPEIARAETLRSQLFARIGEFMTRYDFLVLPVAQVPPFDIEQEYVTEIAGQRMESYVDWMRSCYFISVTGLPAISVPAGFTEEGLPVGLQIVGRHHDDFGVLQIAHAYEQANGISHHHFPPLAREG